MVYMKTQTVKINWNISSSGINLLWLFAKGVEENPSSCGHWPFGWGSERRRARRHRHRSASGIDMIVALGARDGCSGKRAHRQTDQRETPQSGTWSCSGWMKTHRLPGNWRELEHHLKEAKQMIRGEAGFILACHQAERHQWQRVSKQSF